MRFLLDIHTTLESIKLCSGTQLFSVSSGTTRFLVTLAGTTVLLYQMFFPCFALFFKKCFAFLI